MEIGKNKERKEEGREKEMTVYEKRKEKMRKEIKNESEDGRAKAKSRRGEEREEKMWLGKERTKGGRQSSLEEEAVALNI